MKINDVVKEMRMERKFETVKMKRRRRKTPAVNVSKAFLDFAM